MRTSLGPKPPRADGRQKAQGYLATNLAIPGLGSLVAGHKVGIAQMALYLGGFIITFVFGYRFISWSLAHWSEYHGPNATADPIQALHDLWLQARWPCLGIAMCALSWFWALVTSRSLLAGTKAGNAGAPTVP